jgi:hypothetical protein
LGAGRSSVADAACPAEAGAESVQTSGTVMTHKYRGSQQSSREVLPKFIDSTQGEPKNIGISIFVPSGR